MMHRQLQVPRPYLKNATYYTLRRSLSPTTSSKYVKNTQKILYNMLYDLCLARHVKFVICEVLMNENLFGSLGLFSLSFNS